MRNATHNLLANGGRFKMKDYTQLSTVAIKIFSSSNDPESLIERAFEDSGVENMATLGKDKNDGWFIDIASAAGWRIQHNKVFEYIRLITPEGINRVGAYRDDFCKFLVSVIKMEPNLNRGKFKMKNDTQLCADAIEIFSSSNDPESLIERAFIDSDVENMATLGKDKNDGWFVDIASAAGWRIQHNKVFDYIRLITPERKNRAGAYRDDFFKFLESVIKVETQQGKRKNLSPHERRIIVIDDEKKLFVPNAVIYTVNEAREIFKFQVNHPKSGTAYGMAEVLPDLYVVLNTFHEYLKQLKHDAFIELCANLGAREISIEDYEENGKKMDISAGGNLPAMPISGEINVGYAKNQSKNKKVAFLFNQKNKLNTKYDSPWIETEPSWEKMRDLRIKNHVESFDAEFNYIDDMGINTSIAINMCNAGINVGGNFSEMKKTRIKYHVDFWE